MLLVRASRAFMSKGMTEQDEEDVLRMTEYKASHQTSTLSLAPDPLREELYERFDTYPSMHVHSITVVCSAGTKKRTT
jgi:hypothetical protein